MVKASSKTHINRIRDAAFDFTICDQEDDTSPTKELFIINSKLYALTENNLWQIQTPDDVDPDRTIPEAKGATRKIFNTGSKNPLVSRTLVQAKRILDSIVLKNKISKDKIFYSYFLFVKELVGAYNIYDELASGFLELAKGLDQLLQKNKKRRVIPSIPQVENLEDRAHSFFVHCHKSLKQIIELIKIFSNKNFGKKESPLVNLKWIENKDSALYTLLEKDKSWISFIWDIRNAFEHPKDEYYIKIDNIELSPDIKFHPPRWSYRLKNNIQNDKSDILSDIEHILNDMVNFGEEIFIFLCMYYWSDFPYVIYKISDDKIDSTCIVQYAVTADLDALPPRRANTTPSK